MNEQQLKILKAALRLMVNPGESLNTVDQIAGDAIARRGLFAQE